jgi:opacity protein-like surface antigen
MRAGITPAIEGAIAGYGVGLQDSTVRLMDAYQISVAGKVSVPLGSNFEAFGRLGLQHTSVGGYMPAYDTSGNGFLLGAGIEYRFDIGFGSGASVTLDYQLAKTELSGERFQAGTAFDVVARQWTIGLALGF